ncbi:MAG TPA: hypothetical protein VES58_04715 [Syntrophobacteria bacterium]|nr:hypothetical protein [Syntrophobacteria bacterium]
MKEATWKKTDLGRHREVVSILMESALYFDLSLKERLALVRRLVTRMEREVGPEGSEIASALVDCRAVNHTPTA